MYKKLTDLPGELDSHQTYGSLLGPAMEIEDQEVADRYFDLMLNHMKKMAAKDGTGQTDEELESVLRNNLGYYAGYYDRDTRVRVEKLFNCNHHIFGSAKDRTPTQEEAFNAGSAAGRESQDG